MTDNYQDKVAHLLSNFSITPDQIKYEETPELLTITIQLDELEAGRLIGRFAQTLDSLQLLISLMITWWLYKVLMGFLYTPIAYVAIKLLKEKDNAGTAH